jgi:hypothetical protein
MLRTQASKRELSKAWWQDLIKKNSFLLSIAAQAAYTEALIAQVGSGPNCFQGLGSRFPRAEIKRDCLLRMMMMIY